jgi:hypothetical protein
MKTTTYEGTVENGRIKLPDTVHLPDHTKVFVVVPDTRVEPFTVTTGDDGLPLIRTANGTITSQLVKDIETLSAWLFCSTWTYLWLSFGKTMNIITSRVHGFGTQRISQRARYRSSVSLEFLLIHLSVTACHPIKRSAF